MRILLIEDDAVLHDVMLRSLNDAGHRVDLATNVEDADHLWCVQRFDAVLLDLNLPATSSPTSGLASGLQALRQARGRGDRTPVLVLTARDRTDERIAGLDAGADDYLGKPFDLAEVEARLRALVRRAQGTDDVSTLGQLRLDERQQKLASDFQATLDPNDLDAVSRPLSAVLRGKVPAVFEGLAPYDPAVNETMFGSTDVADVSWITPTVQAWVACYAFGTPLHSWQMVSQGQSGLAHAGMVHAAKVLTATAAELVREPALIAAAKAELLERRQGLPYACPIPADVPLPFLRQ